METLTDKLAAALSASDGEALTELVKTVDGYPAVRQLRRAVREAYYAGKLPGVEAERIENLLRQRSVTLKEMLEPVPQELLHRGAGTLAMTTPAAVGLHSERGTEPEGKDREELENEIETLENLITKGWFMRAHRQAVKDYKVLGKLVAGVLKDDDRTRFVYLKRKPGQTVTIGSKKVDGGTVFFRTHDELLPIPGITITGGTVHFAIDPEHLKPEEEEEFVLPAKALGAEIPDDPTHDEPGDTDGEEEADREHLKGQGLHVGPKWRVVSSSNWSRIKPKLKRFGMKIKVLANTSAVRNPKAYLKKLKDELQNRFGIKREAAEPTVKMTGAALQKTEKLFNPDKVNALIAQGTIVPMHLTAKPSDSVAVKGNKLFGGQIVLARPNTSTSPTSAVKLATDLHVVDGGPKLRSDSPTRSNLWAAPLDTLQGAAKSAGFSLDKVEGPALLKLKAMIKSGDAKLPAEVESEIAGETLEETEVPTELVDVRKIKDLAEAAKIETKFTSVVLGDGSRIERGTLLEVVKTCELSDGTIVYEGETCRVRGFLLPVTYEKLTGQTSAHGALCVSVDEARVYVPLALDRDEAAVWPKKEEGR